MKPEDESKLSSALESYNKSLLDKLNEQTKATNKVYDELKKFNERIDKDKQEQEQLEKKKQDENQEKKQDSDEILKEATEDKEMLEDLILTAVKDAMTKAEELAESEMSKVKSRKIMKFTSFNQK